MTGINKRIITDILSDILGCLVLTGILMAAEKWKTDANFRARVFLASKRVAQSQANMWSDVATKAAMEYQKTRC